MPSFPFTVTVTATPSIEVYGTNISYEELLNSFGNYWYLIQQLFLETNTALQVNQPITFDKYDSNGKKKMVVISPATSPYQKLAALYIELDDQGFVIDGQLIITPQVMPSAYVRYTFTTLRGFVGEPLNLYGIPNKNRIDV